MPVVRELVNRISFNVDRGTVSNAENAFSKLKGKGSGLIGFIGGIGGAIKKAAGALTAFSGAATALFVEFEKNTGAANFFSRNKQEAEALLKIVDDIAAKSETTSRREARQAASILSSLVTGTGQLEQIVPFIEKISIANPKADFSDVANSVKAFVEGGDLQELINVIPGIKDELELLGKTDFGQAIGKPLQEARATKLIELLQGSRVRIDELVAEQQETLANAFTRVSKDTSDFTLKFGETIAPAVKDALSSLEGLIEELNKSETFWNTVRLTVESIRDVIKSTKEFIENFKEGGTLAFFGAGNEEELQENVKKINEEREVEREQQIEQNIEGIKNFGKSVLDFFGFGQSPTEKEKSEILTQRDLRTIEPDAPGIPIGNERIQQPESRQTGTQRIEVVLSGNVSQDQSSIKEIFTSIWKNIISENGGVVTQ